MLVDQEVSLALKLAFLKEPKNYPHHPGRVDVTETHMSWVFFAGELVYKLKKPIRNGPMDFRTVDGRRVNCETEDRLNRRLVD